MASIRPATFWRAALTRALLLGLLWLVLAEGQLQAGWLAVLAIASATATSLVLMPPGASRWRLVGLAAFVPFFARLSMLGGLDVARRALDPALPLRPSLRNYRLRLAEEGARVFLANTLSLLPGTVSVELRHDRLRLHLLDESMPVERTLQALEQQVAALFGVALRSPADLDSGWGKEDS